MNREYFAEGLPDLDDPNHAISFDADTIAQALVNIYQKKYGNGKEIEPTLFEKTKEIFEGAINKGVKQSSFSIDTAFKHQLTHNMWVFSAFRTHKMQRDIAKYLLNEKGELKTFTKFVKDVAPYIKHTNRLWLETEYNTAVLRAHQAADWRKFVDERDVLPNLEWQPSTSTNPGEDHKPYWFTCLPIDHKFWKQHRPGDRWNCKCSLRNTDKEPTPVPADTIIKGSEPQRGLESNPGEKGEIFSNNHPYYPENCGKCPFNKGVGKSFAALVGIGIHCNDCKLINKVICENGYTPPEDKRPQKRIKFSEKGKDYGKEWERVYKCEESGGYIAVENGHGTGEKTQNINSAIPLAKDGHAVELIKQTKIKTPDGKKEWMTTRDANVDGEKWEFKLTKNYINLVNSISSKASQAIDQGADVLLIDISRNKQFDIEDLINGIDNSFVFNSTLQKVCVMIESQRYIIVPKVKWEDDTYKKMLRDFIK